MVLAGAGGPARPRLGHVDLRNHVEQGGPVPDEHARQPRCEAGAQDHVQPPLPGLGPQVEEGSHLGLGV